MNILIGSILLISAVVIFLLLRIANTLEEIHTILAIDRKDRVRWWEEIQKRHREKKNGL